MKKTMLICSLLAVASVSWGQMRIADAKIRLTLDRNVLPAERVERAFVRVELEAPPLPKTNVKRTPVNLCMVLDQSGSMHGERIARAKDAMTQVVKHLSQEDILSVVTYDSSARVLIPAQHVENAEVILSRIRSIQAGGSTALFAGVSLGAAELRKNLKGNYVTRMVLLSDGEANVGPDTPEALGELGVSLNKEKIGVSTVGLGTGYNEELMLNLAQKSGANAYFAENPRDLERIFTSELGDALNTVIRGVTITVNCPDGVTPVRIIGFEGTVSGSAATILVDNLNAGQTKYAILEVTVPSVADGRQATIADVKVNYEVVDGGEKREIGESIAASFSKDESRVRSSIQADVAGQVVRQDSLAAQNRVVSDNRQADYDAVKSSADTQMHYNLSLQEVYGQAVQEVVAKENMDLEKMKQEASQAPLPAARAKGISTRNTQKLRQQNFSQ